MKRLAVCVLPVLLALPAAALEPYLVKDINAVAEPAGSDPTNPVAFRGAVLFFADDGTSGKDLWRSDGTAAGTFPLSEGAGLGAPQPYVVTEQPATTAGPQRPARLRCGRRSPWRLAAGILWSTDGTEAGTGPLVDRYGNQIFAPSRFVVLGDRLVFTAQTIFGLTLWESDGTPEGTFPVQPPVAINSPVELAGAGDRVFFPGYDTSTGWELWAVRP
jgi:large repetitive protein